MSKEEKTWYYVRMNNLCGGISTLNGKVYNAPPVWARFIGEPFTVLKTRIERAGGSLKVLKDTERSNNERRSKSEEHY